MSSKNFVSGFITLANPASATYIQSHEPKKPSPFHVKTGQVENKDATINSKTGKLRQSPIVWSMHPPPPKPPPSGSVPVLSMSTAPPDVFILIEMGGPVTLNYLSSPILHDSCQRQLLRRSIEACNLQGEPFAAGLLELPMQYDSANLAGSSTSFDSTPDMQPHQFGSVCSNP